MSKVRKFAGVYMIMCTVNRKVLIGSTENLTKRIQQHRDALNDQGHPCSKLQQDYNLYGRDYIVYERLEEFKVSPGVKVLRQMETEWTMKYDAYDKNHGYNVIVEHRKTLIDNNYKARDRNKRNQVDIAIPYNFTTGNPFIVINIVANSLSIYPSVISFLREHRGYHEANVYRALRYWDTDIPDELKCGNDYKQTVMRSYRGYIFLYAQQYLPEFDYINYKQLPKERSDKGRFRVEHPKRKRGDWIKGNPVENRKLGRKEIVAISIDSSRQVFRSMSEAVNALCIDKRKVNDVLTGRRKSYRGYTFEYTGISER